jgi:integrase
VAALRHHRHWQARLLLAGAQPARVTLRWVQPGQPPRLVELDLAFRTQRGTHSTPTTPAAGFARLALGVGLDAHPHMPRHALASAMAANKEPDSIIAAQLRHADGGGGASGGAKSERNPGRRSTRVPHLRGGQCRGSSRRADTPIP